MSFITVSIDPLATKWEAQLQRLKDFVEKHGTFPYDMEVDALDDESFKLLEWTRRQKLQYKAFQAGEHTTSMTEDRIAKLEEIGFSWNKNLDIWMDHYENLLDYYNHHGNTLVPYNYPANQALSNWVVDQRELYRLHLKGKSSSY